MRAVARRGPVWARLLHLLVRAQTWGQTIAVWAVAQDPGLGMGLVGELEGLPCWAAVSMGEYESW